MQDFKLDNALGYLSAKTSWYIKTYFTNKIKNSNINVTPEQMAILIAVSQNPGISQTEIAGTSLKDKTNVTRMLDVLERNGYITRNNVENDRRKYQILLTGDGINVLDLLIPIANHVNSTCSANLSENELKILKDSLQKICDSIKKLI